RARRRGQGTSVYSPVAVAVGLGTERYRASARNIERDGDDRPGLCGPRNDGRQVVRDQLALRVQGGRRHRSGPRRRGRGPITATSPAAPAADQPEQGEPRQRGLGRELGLGGDRGGHRRRRMQHEAAVGQRGDGFGDLVDRLAAGAAQALEVEGAGVARGTDEEEVRQLDRRLFRQAFDDEVVADAPDGCAGVDRPAARVEDAVGQAGLGVDDRGAALDRDALDDAALPYGFDYQGHVRSRLLAGWLGY